MQLSDTTAQTQIASTGKNLRTTVNNYENKVTNNCHFWVIEEHERKPPYHLKPEHQVAIVLPFTVIENFLGMSDLSEKFKKVTAIRRLDDEAFMQRYNESPRVTDRRREPGVWLCGEDEDEDENGNEMKEQREKKRRRRRRNISFSIII